MPSSDFARVAVLLSEGAALKPLTGGLASRTNPPLSRGVISLLPAPVLCGLLVGPVGLARDAAEGFAKARLAALLIHVGQMLRERSHRFRGG
jgi:hypothetical protein